MTNCKTCKHVVIIAHSYGGQITISLARRFPDDFFHKVAAVFLTDSVHCGMTGIPPLDQRLCDISVNYVTSSMELGTPVKYQGGIKCVSSGTTSHEWTSWYAKDSIFKKIRTLGK